MASNRFQHFNVFLLKSDYFFFHQLFAEIREGELDGSVERGEVVNVLGDGDVERSDECSAIAAVNPNQGLSRRTGPHELRNYERYNVKMFRAVFCTELNGTDYRPHPMDGEGNSFTLSVHTPGRGTYPGQGVPILARSSWGGRYLPWPGPDGGYLPWPGGYRKVGTLPARAG